MPANPYQMNPGVLIQVFQDSTSGARVVALSSKVLYHTILIRGVGAVSAGAVKLSVASADMFSGTFAPIGNPVIGPVTILPNAELMVNIGPMVLPYLKIEFSTPVTGGVASVYYLGNQP